MYEAKKQCRKLGITNIEFGLKENRSDDPMVYQFNPLERIRDLVHPFEPVSVAEEKLDPFVVVLLGRVQHRRAVHLRRLRPVGGHLGR